MSGWRPALLIAWRDALRHRGRSILVLVMISLPVLAVSAAAVVIKTAEVSGVERATRTMGAADARIRTEGRGLVLQMPDPGQSGWGQMGDFDYDNPLTPDDVRAVLGADSRLVPIATGWQRVRVGERVIDFSTTGVDLSDPLAEGLFALQRGDLPQAAGEVVVNDATLAKGLALGDELEVNGTTLRIVGVGRDATVRDRPVLVGAFADLPSDDSNSREWLVKTGPVSWAQVLELNKVGGVVTSRAVLADPPDVATMAEQMGYDTGRDEMLAVVVLIVVMALLEVVLLAGPAFAVGARRHARTLALMAACGGTPAQSRRVILGSGVVLGVVAAGLGLVLGIIAGWALLPLAQRLNGEWFGPFELPWAYLWAITAFGLLSALLASVVPAWLASRQDIVAVLAGRRGDRRSRATTPILGLVLLGVGIAVSTYGALTSDSGNGALWIAASAVISVLGMILVVPVVVSTVARLARRLPLTPRYAARDAARHRTRTVPAVAAVAATVAGVVALGIANASDERKNAITYSPQAQMGAGYLTWDADIVPGEQTPDSTEAWTRITQAVRQAAPEVGVSELRGAGEVHDPNGYTTTYAEWPNDVDEDACCLRTYGAQIAVADTSAELGVEGTSAAVIDETLAAGRAVYFTVETDALAEITIHRDAWRENGDEPEKTTSHKVSAQLVAWDEKAWGPVPAMSVLPTSLSEDLGLKVETTSLRLTGDLDEATQTRVQEAAEGAAEGTYVYVERGYERPAEYVVILLVLFTLGGVLMLGGTLTATFLALSDARPDFATLSAVGASPRTRRAVAASYALVIGFVGAVLGAGVGFIPGVAISRPLTSMSESGPYLDIPWQMIGGLVVALPLLTAAIVGLTARSRLPLVARLD